MITKLFEVRDSMTLVAALAIKIDHADERDGFLLRRSGYPVDGGPWIVLTKISGGVGQSTCDPYDWGDRTMRTAHAHIVARWDDLATGDVVDVEYILGETTTAKVSERAEEDVARRELLFLARPEGLDVHGTAVAVADYAVREVEKARARKGLPPLRREEDDEKTDETKKEKK